MIRAGPIDIGDYNVENTTLTAEDETNPELLTELENLRIDNSEAGGRSEDKSLEERIKDAKHETLSLKRSGDVEGAARAFREYESLKAELLVPTKPKAKETAVIAQPIEITPEPIIAVTESNPATGLSEMDMLRHLALEAKHRGDMAQAREYMSQMMKLGGFKPKASPFRDLANKLEVQSGQCREIARGLLLAGDKVEAVQFARREKAFERDMLLLRNLIKQKQDPPQTTTIPVEIPIDNTNREIEEDVLLISLEQIKAGPKARFKPGNSENYLCVLLLDWPPQNPSDHRQQITFVGIPSCGKLSMKWTGVKRDLRTAKYFEHHRLKIELYRQESSFFRKKHVLLGYTTLRMNVLASTGKMSERVEFVDENRRLLGVSAIVNLATRTPLSPKAALSFKKTVEWTIVIAGESGRMFNLHPPHPPVKSELESAEELAKDIVSYVVLEEEINRLKADSTSSTDPASLGLLMALENKLDQLTVAVDLGQLSIKQYLQQVTDAIPVAKQKALFYKRAGDLDEARRWLRHIHLMENEIKEATDAES